MKNTLRINNFYEEDWGRIDLYINLKKFIKEKSFCILTSFKLYFSKRFFIILKTKISKNGRID